MHKENIRIFAASGKNEMNAPLIRLYDLLVATELALKDSLPQWEKGHKIRDLVGKVHSNPIRVDTRTDQTAPDLQAGIISLVAQVNDKMKNLNCTARDGSSASVDPDNYPGIRYVHFKTDFPADGTDDTQINNILDIVKDLHTELRKEGITI